MIWRVVLEQIATLQEVETHWSIDDLADATEVLDYRDAVRSAANRERSRP